MVSKDENISAETRTCRKFTFDTYRLTSIPLVAGLVKQHRWNTCWPSQCTFVRQWSSWFAASLKLTRVLPLDSPPVRRFWQHVSMSMLRQRNKHPAYCCTGLGRTHRARPRVGRPRRSQRTPAFSCNAGNDSKLFPSRQRKRRRRLRRLSQPPRHCLGQYV